MQYSSRLPIAVHILLALEIFKGEYKTTSDFLASSVNVNPVIIRNTLGKLKKAGLITVEAGVGGAALAKAPEDITLLDVFYAVEEDEDLFHFHEHPNQLCPVGRNIHAVLDERLQNAYDSMLDSLRAVTLKMLIDDTREKIQEQTAPAADADSGQD